MPSFPNDFAYAKFIITLAVAAWRAPSVLEEGINYPYPLVWHASITLGSHC